MAELPTQAELRDQLLGAIQRQKQAQDDAAALRRANRVPDAGTEAE